MSSPNSQPPLSKYDKKLSNEKPNTKPNYTNSVKKWQTPRPNNKPHKPQTSSGVLTNGTALPNKHNMLANRKPDNATLTYSNNNRKQPPPTATSANASAKWNSEPRHSLENKPVWLKPPKAPK
jgi:hypothetical protein